jgi:hypothetical protein
MSDILQAYFIIGAVWSCLVIIPMFYRIYGNSSLIIAIAFMHAIAWVTSISIVLRILFRIFVNRTNGSNRETTGS